MMRIAELGDRKTEPLSVCGFVVDGYETVARAFAAAIAKTTRGGAALAIQVGGETVADLWGGYADHATGRAWRSDTPTVVFSCSKGLVAILAAQLVAEGRLDLDARVASYWPEFAQGGKADVPVRYLLSHRAGLPYPARDLSKQDIVGWYPVVEELAAQVPLWEPGRNWAYHALTYGWLVGEVLRRVSGKSVGALMEEKLTGPLGAAAWFGAPADRRADVANIASSAERTTDALDSAPHGREIARCLTLGRAFPLGLAAPGKGFNDPENSGCADSGSRCDRHRAWAGIHLVFNRGRNGEDASTRPIGHFGHDSGPIQRSVLLRAGSAGHPPLGDRIHGRCACTSFPELGVIRSRWRRRPVGLR